MAQCATCVNRLYKSIIDEVISSVRDEFLDEGIDGQVLMEVKQAWEQKVAATQATNHSDTLAGTGTLSNQQVNAQQQMQQQVASGLTGQAQANSLQQQQQQMHQQQQQQQQQQTVQTQSNLVPVQITVPAQQAGGIAKTIAIHVPSTALASGIAGAQLQSILSAPAAAATFSLDPVNAAQVIQRQLNIALQKRGIALPTQLLQIAGQDTQVDGAVDQAVSGCASCSVHKRTKRRQKEKRPPSDDSLALNASVSVDRDTLDRIVIDRLQSKQVDGPLDDSSDEMSGDDDDDEDDKDEEDDKDKKLEDEEEDQDTGDVNEDPLNSADDISDDESGEAFDTENVVVCQYDKVTRVRNKWRFNLKDGIMNLKGKDYVFLKATGEGEW